MTVYARQMKLHHLSVSCFRGIKQLDWHLSGSFSFLVGPGDSTKSTILDAIEAVLSPRWNLSFDDTDFYDRNTAQPILIRATVGQLPSSLLRENKFGLQIRGWSPSSLVVDEPGDGDEPVLTLQLKVDVSLEPEWRVVNDRIPEGVVVTAKDRELLGVSRLGAAIDKHLSWATGSALAKLTGDLGSVGKTLAEAGRAARQALLPSSLPDLAAAAVVAEEIGKDFGAPSRSRFVPRLDVQAVTAGSGGITLHDGEVPTRRNGLGSRRLLVLGLQRHFSPDGGISLVDEVEHGLEPHRLRGLLSILRPEEEQGHVIGTTHAPVVVQELRSGELQVVRARAGRIQIVTVPDEVLRVAKKVPEALLGRKVLVCEGRTELGFSRYLDRAWASDGAPTFAALGLALADGGGDEAPGVALCLANLGYEVALLADSDKAISPTEADLRAGGVAVFRWADSLCLEQRVARDISKSGIEAMVTSAMEEHGEESVIAAVAIALGIEPKDIGAVTDIWWDLFAEGDIRDAVGAAAKGKGKRPSWFKRTDLGERLAAIVLDHLDPAVESDLSRVLEALRKWAVGPEVPGGA